MRLALAGLALAIALAAIATRPDCDGLSQADCERLEQINDAIID